MKTLVRLFVAGIAVVAVLQLVRPSIPAKPATAEIQAPPQVIRILEKDCYSCHSDQRRLAWFDEIVPAYWLVRHDILTAREHLNFSTIGSKPAPAQKAALYEAVNMIQLGAMPLPQFLALHPGARVTPEELATLKTYLAPWKPVPEQPANTAGGPNANSASGPGETSAPVSLTAVQPEPNGFPFDSDFENWKPISTTDRGDNGTFRFILGNDIAVQAAQSGNISPWPDDARFAKIAWQQQPGPDGLIHPGKFVQVELMVKGAERYKDTDGWGWGRWRGLDLKPYGSTAGFVNECTGCHMPVRGNDYVYTLPMTAAKTTGAKSISAEVVNNHAAALPSTLPYQPLGWNAITMYVDPKTLTTATLYGDADAIHAIHPRDNPTLTTYPASAVLALVTWAQRDDPHWFGARIPDVPLSVEFVQVGVAGQITSYRRFAGTGLVEEHADATAAAQRGSFIVSLPPARLP
jgi:hypothetical protein